MRKYTLFILVMAALAMGCVAKASVPKMSPRAQVVRTGKGDPGPGMHEVGPVEASNGSGCGGFGTEGSYEGALAELKNRAAALGADYVQIFTMEGPYLSGKCRENAFVIRGMAFRSQAAATPSASAAAPQPK